MNLGTHSSNACGQIVCSGCYSDLFPLEYLDGQERQICETCKVIFETRKFITDVNNEPDQEVLENEEVGGNYSEKFVKLDKKKLLCNFTNFFGMVKIRVVYDRVRKRKKYFEIPAFLQIE